MVKCAIHYVTLQEISVGQAGWTHVHEIADGLRFVGHRVRLSARSSRTRSLLRNAISVARAQLLVSLDSSEVVYMRAHPLGLLLVVRCKLMGTPIVLELNGSVDDAFKMWPTLSKAKPMVTALWEQQFRMANGVVAVTPQLADWVKGLREDGRIACVSNGVNADLFATSRESLGARERPYMVFFGALSPWQGIRTIISATQEVEWPPEVELVISGKGELEDEVISASERGTNVVYVGVTQYDKVPELVRGSIGSLIIKEGDFVASGLSPLKLYESVAAGVPIVVSDQVDLVKFVRTHCNGVVVRQGDPAGVARAVRSVFNGSIETAACAEAQDFVLRSQSWRTKALETSEHLRRWCSPHD